MAMLQTQIRAIERGPSVMGATESNQSWAQVWSLPFGVAGLDACLPEGGLPLAAVHEMRGTEGALPGFCAALLGRLAGMDENARKPVLWIEAGARLYMPGLVPFGLTPGQLLVASGIPRQADRLWAFEEALRSGALAGVVAELDEADFTASRRLQLAAEEGRTTGFFVTGNKGKNKGMATAMTRWQVVAAPGTAVSIAAGPFGIGNPCWDVSLIHCRGGRPGHFNLIWEDRAWVEVVVPALVANTNEPADDLPLFDRPLFAQDAG